MIRGVIVFIIGINMLKWGVVNDGLTGVSVAVTGLAIALFGLWFCLSQGRKMRRK